LRSLVDADRGGALVTFVLTLPLVLLLLAFCVEAGRLFYARALLQAVADHAALGAVQELDFDALAEGTINLKQQKARTTAHTYITENCRRLGLGNWLVASTVRVRVYNAQPAATLRNEWTGRRLEYPTVCILMQAEFEPVLPLTQFATGFDGGPELRVRVHADASVEPRER
jgi:Flp pilus assembly protein TadG